MSVVVRPAGEADIDGAVDLLHGHMSSKITRERWRTLLDYPWRPADASRGTVAADRERVVGFLGLVYADRAIAGGVERFCNICAWYLHKDYRGRGIGREIQYQSIADKRLVYTLVTATDGTDRAFRGGGFRYSTTSATCFAGAPTHSRCWSGWKAPPSRRSSRRRSAESSKTTAPSTCVTSSCRRASAHAI